MPSTSNALKTRQGANGAGASSSAMRQVTKRTSAKKAGVAIKKRQEEQKKEVKADKKGKGRPVDSSDESEQARCAPAPALIHTPAHSATTRAHTLCC